MKITKTDIDQLNAKLRLVVEPVDYEERVLKELKNIRKKANFPGFRPGMVPMSRVKLQYGKAVLAEELNNAINDGIYEYLKNNNINILAEPLPNAESPEIDLENETEYTFDFDIAIAPEFELPLTEADTLPIYNILVTDEMIDNHIDMLANRFGEETFVDNYTTGDRLIVTAKENKEGGLIVEDVHFLPTMIKDEELKALFNEAKVGDVITLDIVKAFPSESERVSMLKIEKEQLQGLTNEFTFKVEKVSHWVKAEVNEELFKLAYGEEVTDEATFRVRVAETIKTYFPERVNYRFGEDCRQAVLKKLENTEFPEAFLKRWLLAKNDEKLTEESLEKEFPLMLNDLKWMLAKEKFISKYEVKVEQKDVDAYAVKLVRAQLGYYGSMLSDEDCKNYAKKVLEDKENLRGIIDRVTEEKVFEAIKEHITIENKDITVEEFDKLD